ncbi:MAG TPA: hypothetical protein VFD27_01235 [Chthoniobacteraceae bacterium]|nr:hypothetical protein [Chthoniobacteraceae bacterium]
MKTKNPEDITLATNKPKKAETKIRDLAPKKDVKGGYVPPKPLPPPR